MDAVQVDPKHHKIEFENERVRVLRVVFGAGETSPEHEHPARVTVFLHDYQTTNRLADGSTDQRRRRAGDTEWRPPVKHVPHADVDYENIQVEIKPHAARHAPLMLPLDPVLLDPKHYGVDFENEYVRVVRIVYGPKEHSVRHEHGGGVLVLLTDLHVRLTREDGTTTEERGKATEVSWRAPATHILENLSQHSLKAILIELK